MKREDLAFTIEDRGGIMVLQYDNGGCHPANDNEIAMWGLIGQLTEHCAVQKDIIEQYQREQLPVLDPKFFGKKVRIKTWDEMVDEFGLEAKFGKNINTMPWFTIHLEASLPDSRIVTISEDGRFLGLVVPSAAIAEIAH